MSSERDDPQLTPQPHPALPKPRRTPNRPRKNPHKSLQRSAPNRNPTRPIRRATHAARRRKDLHSLHRALPRDGEILRGVAFETRLEIVQRTAERPLCSDH
jgi:hypothetical protein